MEKQVFLEHEVQLDALRKRFDALEKRLHDLSLKLGELDGRVSLLEIQCFPKTLKWTP
jgi:hypothetical protein